MSGLKGKIEETRGFKMLEMPKGGEIRFENVSFGYVSSRPILKSVSFVIPAGKRVAFVGPSGCGKSTVLRLITRFFDPQDGRIFIDDQDIKQVDVQSVREKVGMMSQDLILFNQTIKDNIGYGNPDASFKDIQKAVEMAELGRAIESFPKGFDTHVGERGLMISGGEKQRVQLARMFLKDAPIALFDEPTSSLDQNTETKIMSTIYNWIDENNRFTLEKGLKKTAVFIAHRLATVSNCDLIYVFDNNGRIIEQGNHLSLMELKGMYAEMWNSQSNSTNDA